MMKFDEREVRAALDRRLSVLEASGARRREIRMRISGGRSAAKRRLPVRAALVLALLLALTGAALAAGIANLFEFFGRGDGRLAMIAEDAVPTARQSQKVETEALGVTVGVIHNAYYDGESLLVGYSIENGRRIESFMPSPGLLENVQMERIEYEPVAETKEEKQLVEAFRKAKERGEPAGLVIYEVYPGDHSFGNEVDLDAWTEREADAGAGVQYVLREYVTPLPEAIRNQDVLTLRMPLRRLTTYLWFDGRETWFFNGEPQPAGEMTAAVCRTEAETLHYAGTGACGGVEVRAEARVSAVRGTLMLTGDGAFPEIKDQRYDLRLYDEQGNRLDMAAMAVSHPGRIEAVFYANGSLPEKLKLLICMEGEGELKPVAGPIELRIVE